MNRCVEIGGQNHLLFEAHRAYTTPTKGLCRASSKLNIWSCFYKFTNGVVIPKYMHIYIYTPHFHCFEVFFIHASNLYSIPIFYMFCGELFLLNMSEFPLFVKPFLWLFWGRQNEHHPEITMKSPDRCSLQNIDLLYRLIPYTNLVPETTSLKQPIPM